MVLTIDDKHNKLKLTSIMRDSYVKMEGRGQDKLNHAYAFGGPELAIKTINQNFNLNIKDFATVNFSTLPKL
jgi:polyisoprenyl-teichoic acid--peptidoglycan teichoic acid transferase